MEAINQPIELVGITSTLPHPPPSPQPINTNYEPKEFFSFCLIKSRLIFCFKTKIRSNSEKQMFTAKSKIFMKIILNGKKTFGPGFYGP